jgi:hypothetical protein
MTDVSFKNLKELADFDISQRSNFKTTRLMRDGEEAYCLGTVFPVSVFGKEVCFELNVQGQPDFLVEHVSPEEGVVNWVDEIREVDEMIQFVKGYFITLKQPLYKFASPEMQAVVDEYLHSQKS